MSALIAGCGTSGSNQTLSDSASLLTALENWSALQVPVEQAVGVLTQQCMAGQGYTYYPFPQPGQPGGGPALFASPLFGSSLWVGPQSLAWRVVNGWGLYEQTMQQLSQPGGFNGSRPQEIKVMQSLRGGDMRRYMKALYGGGKTEKIRVPGLPHFTIQIGGCNTTSGTRLFGSVAASVAVPEYGPVILNNDVRASASHSPALRASQAVWAACVYAHTRLHARSPSQLFLHFYSLYQTKGPTPAVHRQELAAAVADLQCQRRSRLPQVVRKQSLAAVRRLPAPVVGELESLLSALQQARTRAQKVFEHPSTSGSVTNGAVTGAGSSRGAQGTNGSPQTRRSVVVIGA